MSNDVPTEAPDPFAPPEHDGGSPDAPARSLNGGRGPWSDGGELVVHGRSRPGPVTWRDGKPATTPVRTTLTWHPKWVWAVLVLGVLPYLLARAITLRRVRVTAPAHVGTTWVRWGGLAAAVGLVIGGMLVLLAFPPIFLLATVLLRLAVIVIAWTWPLARVRHIESNRAWLKTHFDAVAGLPELPRGQG